MKFQRIQNLREDADLTQKELSEYLHISPRTYSHYENGTRNIPVEMLIRLAIITTPALIIWSAERITLTGEKTKNNEIEQQ